MFPPPGFQKEPQILGDAVGLVGLLITTAFTVVIVALWDVTRRPESAWRAAKKSQLLWVFLCLTVPGALVYLLWVRRRVMEAQYDE